MTVTAAPKTTAAACAEASVDACAPTCASARHDDSRPASGSLHSWDLSSGIDGPGTRLVLFTAGCPLRCLYCHNPDTWSRHNGTEVTLEQVMQRVDRYRRLFELTGGGVTVSGGEPLLQHRFTAALLRECTESGVHTALDTSGSLGYRLDDDALADVGLCLLDIKAFDPDVYRKVARGELAPTLRFAHRLAEAARPVWIRYVLVPGLTDDLDQIERLADFVAGLGNVERVDVLAFHHLGQHKYDALKIPFPLAGVPGPTQESLDAARARFAERGLTVT